jgi:tetratricopeptide (TPR) repeat protein
MKRDHLVELEQKALALQKSGKTREAADVFAVLVKEQPDWEHGTGFYSLAFCLEELGEYDSAEKSYIEALRYEPKNPYFLGGYACFQSLHRDPQKAFDTYLTLLKVESSNRHQKGIESAVTALKTLGKKIGLSDEAVAEKLKVSTT